MFRPRSLSPVCNQKWGAATKTRSSAIAEGPRDAPCQLKSYEISHNFRRIAFDKTCNRRMTSRSSKVTGNGQKR